MLDGEGVEVSMVVRGFAMGFAVGKGSKVFDGSVGEWSRIERRWELECGCFGDVLTESVKKHRTDKH